jgi:hypothetical protein
MSIQALELDLRQLGEPMALRKNEPWPELPRRGAVQFAW